VVLIKNGFKNGSKERVGMSFWGVTEWGRGWVMGGNTAIGQPHQTNRIYDYTFKLKLYHFHPISIISR